MYCRWVPATADTFLQEIVWLPAPGDQQSSEPCPQGSIFEAYSVVVGALLYKPEGRGFELDNVNDFYEFT
jgi:hypothetical protein